MSITTPPTTDHVTVFYASWCPYCQKLRKALDNANTPYSAIDVDAPGTDDLNEWIKSVNNGNRIVPTVLYSDGTHATNPPAADVRAKLAELSS